MTDTPSPGKKLRITGDACLSEAVKVNALGNDLYKLLSQDSDVGFPYWLVDNVFVGYASERPAPNQVMIGVDTLKMVLARHRLLVEVETGLRINKDPSEEIPSIMPDGGADAFIQKPGSIAKLMKHPAALVRALARALHKDPEAKLGYMCAVDYRFHLENDVSPQKIYNSEESLREKKVCAFGDCGAVEVEVRVKRVIHEGHGT